jgi:DNA-binding transcriptional ArsR family regulator
MQPPIGDAFAALGDPTRRRIVELLAVHDGRSVGQLASELPISRPAVSRHLALLKRAGLVIDEPRGTRRIYRLQAHGVGAVRDYLEQLWGQSARAFVQAAEGKSGRGDR